MIGPRAELFLQDYVREYGERKFRKVVHSVKNDRRFDGFISECLHRRLLPSPSDFYACVMNNVLWGLSRKSRITAATLILLARWEDEVNMRLDIVPDYEIPFFSERLIEFGRDLGV